jgi:hypothetical protein
MTDSRWNSLFSVTAVSVLRAQCFVCQKNAEERNFLSLSAELLDFGNKNSVWR